VARGIKMTAGYVSRARNRRRKYLARIGELNE
jgi:hypothetical protein